jgi:tripartite ATP-independent transporter DctP family solute receptor
MNRKHFYEILVVALISVVAVVAVPSASAQTVLKFNHTDTPSGTRHRAAELFAQRVADFTDGRYQVMVFHSGQLGNDPKSIELVSKGKLDFTISATGSYASIQPTLNLTALPFLFDSYEHGWRFYDQSKWLKDQFAGMHAKGIRVVGTWEAGFRNFTTKTPLSDPSAAKGKSMRVFPNPMIKSIMESIGFTTQVIPVPEVYRAIQEGKVIGQENPIDTIYALRFFEVAPHITLTQHVYSPLPVVIAEQTWAKIASPDRQHILRAASIAAEYSRKAVRNNEARLLELMATRGATIARPNLAPFKAATVVVYDEARKTSAAEMDKLLAEVSALSR